MTALDDGIRTSVPDSSPTAAPRVRAERVSLGYADRTVVTDLTVAVPDGKVTVVVGPNGCGKSTLLRGLSRLLRPKDGRVLLGDRQFGHGRPVRGEMQRRVDMRAGVFAKAPFVQVERILGVAELLLDEELLAAEIGRECFPEFMRQVLRLHRRALREQRSLEAAKKRSP